MNQKHLYLILKSIENNSSINLLRREGLSFSQISTLLSKAINDNYIKYAEEIIVLSEKGKQKFSDLANHYKETDKDLWIEKEKSSQISKIEIDSIFLPDKNNLSF